jgi:hypothetical protein
MSNSKTLPKLDINSNGVNVPEKVAEKDNVPNPEDPEAPSKEVSSKKQSLSDLFTIFCAGFALISDGYQNSLMWVVSRRVW